MLVSVRWATAHPGTIHCGVVTLNCPLHPETERTINDKTLKNSNVVRISSIRRVENCAIAMRLLGLWIAANWRLRRDVWFLQPPPQSHPWRTMPHPGMTPHISGTSLSAQARYAAGPREILECHFEGLPIRGEYLIAQEGKLAGVGAHPTALAMLLAGQKKQPSSV